GIRMIVGVCFFSIALSLWMFTFLGYPLRFAEFDQLLPVMESNMVTILKGAHKMTLTIVGFEILYVIYPYLEKKDNIQKYAHIGIAVTTIVYLLLMLVALVYFSPGQLESTIWPTLSLFKIVKLPFIERTEYVAVTFWLLIILPNLMLYLWAAVRGVKRTFGRNTKGILWIFTTFIFVMSLFINTRVKINRFNDFFASVAFYITFCYPLVLYAFALLKKKLNAYKEKMQ
ncbi:MAG: spore gernimation protein, partial [Neobacillus sp.]|nr:spore gernimation protein [Neobacillus sp.]